MKTNDYVSFGPIVSSNQEYALVAYFSVKKALRMLSRKRNEPRQTSADADERPLAELDVSADLQNSEPSVVYTLSPLDTMFVDQVVCKFHGQMRRQALDLDAEYAYRMSPTARVVQVTEADVIHT
jgi:hypothetical protein